MRPLILLCLLVAGTCLGGQSAVPAQAASVSGFALVKGTTFNGSLVAVSAHSANDVWAVGGQRLPGASETSPYAEHWNGHTWATVPTPMPTGDFEAWFQSVSAVSATDVWAAGRSSGLSDGFVEHWNGKHWSQVSGPHGGQILALSATSVWSIGGFVDYSALPEHWNGSTWTVNSPPNVNGSLVVWYTATGRPRNVWLTGYVGDAAGRSPVMAHWDGTSWTESVQPIPAGDDRAEVQGLSISSTGRVYGVGFTDSGNVLHAFALTDDNGAWSEPSFTNYPTEHQLWGVAATGDGSAWAVGNRLTPSYADRTLIEHWDEATHEWTDLGGPNPCTYDGLNGVAAIGGTQTGAYAVGGCTGTDGVTHPLILRHS